MTEIEAVARAIHQYGADVRTRFDSTLQEPPYEHDKTGFYAGAAQAAIHAYEQSPRQQARQAVVEALSRLRVESLMPHKYGMTLTGEWDDIMAVHNWMDEIQRPAKLESGDG